VTPTIDCFTWGGVVKLCHESQAQVRPGWNSIVLNQIVIMREKEKGTVREEEVDFFCLIPLLLEVIQSDESRYYDVFLACLAHSECVFLASFPLFLSVS
jgi:hypothetical protein